MDYRIAETEWLGSIMNNNSQYGYLWLSEIKKQAKKMKVTHPQLNYTQRLDVASQKGVGVRHYHEAQSRHKRYIASLQEDKGSDMVTCRYCDYTFWVKVQMS